MAVDGQKFMTKTQHYRKVTKPLLERKRRARMNLYLDELKDLIVDTMEAQGEHITKLEKADILELTVNYLKTQRHSMEIENQNQNSVQGQSNSNVQINIEKFRDGYTQAVFEISKVFSQLPGLNVKCGTHLMQHLGHQLKDLNFSLINKSKLNQTKDIANDLTLQELKIKQNPATPASMMLQPKVEDVWRPW